MQLIKISDLPNGMIIWKGFRVVGITGYTLDKKYNDLYCTKIPGNPYDYELYAEKRRIQKSTK